MKIGKIALKHPKAIWNIDGTHNQDGTIKHYTELQVRTGTKTANMRFLVTNLGEDEIILGYPWLAAFKPNIDWANAVLEEDMQPLVIKTLGLNNEAEAEKIAKAWTTAAEQMAEPGEEVFVTKTSEVSIKKTSTSAQLAAQHAPIEGDWKQIVPPQYHKWKKVFSEQEATRMPKHQPWDIEIELIDQAPPSLDCKIYPLTAIEQGKLAEYIKENIDKGYIRPSKSRYSSPFFFVGKKDGKLRPVVDYRRLNSLTVPDRYPLPLIQELVDKVSKAKIFSKVDVRAGYNNIRIKDGDQAKAAFKTNMGLYEPVVMPFGLRNAPAVFQRMVNVQFADILAQEGVVNYMDDFLIATNDIKRHRYLVNLLLERLQKCDLFLKPSKCIFEAKRVEFLGVILENGTVTMDPVKVSGVADWKTPKNVRDIRKFLGFCNFYRRFIRGFSQIAKALNNRLRKGVRWEWGSAEEESFQKLKSLICQEPVLQQPDQKKPFEVEVDASNYAIGAVLIQRDEKNIPHPVAFFSKTLNEAQRNYDVYNRELLALVETCRHWRPYMHQPMHTVTIYTDHANLTFWKNPGNHNRRVARWHAELMEYDFKLQHIAGKRNGRADALSRRPDYDQGEEDNKQLVVLPEERFAKIRLAGTEEANPSNPLEWWRYQDNIDSQAFITLHERVLEQQKRNQEQIKRWANTYSLTNSTQGWQKDLYKTVVAGDNNLKRGIIYLFHDTPSAGHPGISNTLKILQRDFWWPTMRTDVEQYVKGCGKCQANKINTRPMKPGIHPITPAHTKPFETVAMDFIVKLPKSGKYDSILTVTDHDCTKAAIFIPCKEEITAEGVAQLYLRHVYNRFGLPKKIISDRDTRFTSKFAKDLCRTLGIQQNISTAFHPQTDGQSERTNQWLEQYLRSFCKETQNDWAIWLPQAEFAHNQWPSDTTKKTPFELIMGYNPSMHWKKGDASTPAVEERLNQLQQVRQEATEQIHKAQNSLQERDKRNKSFKRYHEGDMVWLEGRNLKLPYPTAKLAPKRVGPFKVLKQVSEVAYQLELPATWKIHDTFHAGLITPYKETEVHGPNFTRPPPDLVMGEDEYEVERIIGKKQKGRGRKTHYLVKWKGYPTSDNSWEPAEHLHADELIREYEEELGETRTNKRRRR